MVSGDIPSLKTLALEGMSGQLHTPPALPLAKDSQYPLNDAVDILTEKEPNFVSSARAKRCVQDMVSWYKEILWAKNIQTRQSTRHKRCLEDEHNQAYSTHISNSVMHFLTMYTNPITNMHQQSTQRIDHSYIYCLAHTCFSLIWPASKMRS